MIGTYCPTCGCRTIRWAGCDDEWHGFVPQEHTFGLYNETSPGGVGTPAEALDTNNLFWRFPVPVPDVTTSVNPCPAPDGV